MFKLLEKNKRIFLSKIKIRLNHVHNTENLYIQACKAYKLAETKLFARIADVDAIFSSPVSAFASFLLLIKLDLLRGETYFQLPYLRSPVVLVQPSALCSKCLPKKNPVLISLLATFFKSRKTSHRLAILGKPSLIFKATTFMFKVLPPYQLPQLLSTHYNLESHLMFYS